MKILSKYLISTLLMALVVAGAVYADTATFTLDAEFDTGSLDGVNHDVPNNDQLQLNTTATTFPNLWVANAGEDSLSKIDTDGDGGNGCEIARYLTWYRDPAAGLANHGAFSGAAPSRTAVNIDGDVYVANRHFDGLTPDLIKIASEGGIDRNGNGVIDTSTDTNGNCTIEPSEMLAVIDDGDGVLDIDDFMDERIIWVRQYAQPGNLGRSLCLDLDGNAWAGTFSNAAYYKFDPDGNLLAGPITTGTPNYGCAVDGNGRLWGANLGSNLIEVDTNTDAHVINRAGSSNYGITLGNDKVYLGSTLRSFDPVANAFGPIIAGGGTGVAVDGDGAVWFGTPTLRKFVVDPNTGFLDTTPVCSVATLGSRGPVIDKDGDPWTINLNNNSVSQYDSNCNFISTIPVGNSPYTYSDATGFSLRNFSISTGTWTVIHDTGGAATDLQLVSWSEILPAGAEVIVEVRAADTEAGLTVVTYQAVGNGVDIVGVQGQFIQVRVRLTENDNEESPILEDLTIQFGGDGGGDPTLEFVKEIIDGPDRDNDGEVDSVIGVKQQQTTEYIWTISFTGPEDTNVLIKDGAPAESVINQVNNNSADFPLGCGELTAFSDDTGDITVSRGGKVGKNCHSSTKFEWLLGSNDEVLTVAASMRPSPGRGHKNPAFAPTSCGALYLNNGAVAWLLDPVTGQRATDPETGDELPPMESNALCLAAVRNPTEFGADADNDDDGLFDVDEACHNEIKTDPCREDTDGDGISDSQDNCPLTPAIIDVNQDGCEDLL